VQEAQEHQVGTHEHVRQHPARALIGRADQRGAEAVVAESQESAV